MEKKIKYIRSKVGQYDKHIVDENNEKIASLLRNANGIGYTVLIYFKVENYIPIQTNDCLSAIAKVRDLLNSVGIKTTIA